MLRRGYASLGNAPVASIIFYRIRMNIYQPYSDLEKELNNAETLNRNHSGSGCPYGLWRRSLCV